MCWSLKTRRSRRSKATPCPKEIKERGGNDLKRRGARAKEGRENATTQVASIAV